MNSTPHYLCLMRHAKSSWKDGSLSDHQRPLNTRGREAAHLIGATLSAKGFAPDIIWSSDAKRTRETAMRLIRAIPGAQEVNYNPDFYHASPDQVINICDQNPFPDKNLMLLGHNPGWAGLFHYLSNIEHNFPTAACAVFKVKTGVDIASQAHWLAPENWTFVELLLPRELA